MTVQKLTDTLMKIISDARREKARLLVAIDGRCASGKTTLALELGRIYGCSVIHMDHFFLRPEQRTPERLRTPGGNVDHERFLKEVLIPLRNREKFSYRPFDCESLAFSEPVRIHSGAVNIIEGSYSCHASLWDYYDLRIFLSVSPDEQLRRIILRNGAEKSEIFKSRWIPLEEEYFSAFDIAGRCDYCFTVQRSGGNLSG